MSDIEYVSTPHSYSSAVAAGDYVFLGLHRGSGEDFETQLHNTLAYMRETLATFSLDLSALVKVHVWLRDISDLPAMEKGFVDYFETDHFPARMTATTKFVDDDCLLMIEGTAYRGT